MAGTPLADPALLRDLVISNRILANEGVLDAFGHVSVRHPERPDEYIIARSCGPELVTEDDLQSFKLTGEQTGGNPLPPYAERAIHGAVYEARPEVMAVCHNHSPSTIPYGVTGVPLRPIYHMASLLGGEVPVWDIADEFGDTDLLVKTMDQGRSLARLLGPRATALMRGHGSVVAGNSVQTVTITCVYMESNARLQLQAMALGPVRYLSDGEARLMGDVMRAPLSAERAWRTWRRRVGFGD